MASPSEIAAYLGAAAWLPIIGNLVYRAFVRPFVTISPDTSVTIGFTGFGPSFNLNLAGSVEKKDATLEHLAVTLSHENGDSHRLVWTSMSETFSQVRDAAGMQQQIVEKEHRVIALRLSTNLLTERFVRFQDPAFHEAAKEPAHAVAQHGLFLIGQGRYNELLQSQQCHDLLQEIKNQFWWAPGRYTVEFHIRSPHRASIRKRQYSFALSKVDIEMLRNNLPLIEWALEDMIRQHEPEYTPKNPQWKTVLADLKPSGPI